MTEHSASHNIAAIKDEPIDKSNEDESEPADMKCQVIDTEDNVADDMEDVRSSDAATMKQELDIGLTVLQLPDIHFMLRPCKQEPADMTPQDNNMLQHRRSHNSAGEQHNIHSELSTENKQPYAGTTHGCVHCSKYIAQINPASDISQNCNVCNKSYLQNDKIHKMINVHHRIHTDERPYNCEVCSKSFTDKNDLIRHRRIHTGERPYNCEVCSKNFTKQSNLIRHSSIHTGERPYNCEVCSKSFTEKNVLIRHKRNHTGERPYNCEVCSKSFMVQNHLIRHRKTHTGERPYNCEVCSKSFTDKNYLITHRRIHTGERPYNCEVCSKSFMARSHLIRHRKTHTGERPYN